MVETDKPKQHRSRVLEGMAHAVSQKGYGDTTIADIVREASVSRRTFYEHFSSKAECLVALYEAASHNSLKVLRDAIDPAHEWQTQVERALAAYLGSMQANPVLVRTLFIEILHLGPEGLAARRRVNSVVADFILSMVNGSKGPKSHVLSSGMATAIVGGINELVLEYIEQDKVKYLDELVQPASDLVHAITRT
ncbi:TetR/AcrR family transcriptional regulator [Ramlibacter tataouinensis]|uniref:TetR family transcriptional regulator n=1 Tax=Ramlibacter tataouinensis TaxID=94132 RepID=A0A127JZ55_9BURK|nr:TetR/AcrR family transcriptional regulator [Ramlibacter tataouinensis]AMO25165.1 TetR family transcriptional regulator [Ramlibacter tataouinensis]